MTDERPLMKRIESSTEINALLESLMIRLRADAAILYKFIDADEEIEEMLAEEADADNEIEEQADDEVDNDDSESSKKSDENDENENERDKDKEGPYSQNHESVENCVSELEIAELLQLLSKSSQVQNDRFFYERVINNIQFEEHVISNRKVDVFIEENIQLKKHIKTKDRNTEISGKNESSRSEIIKKTDILIRRLEQIINDIEDNRNPESGTDKELIGILKKNIDPETAIRGIRVHAKFAAKINTLLKKIKQNGPDKSDIQHGNISGEKVINNTIVCKYNTLVKCIVCLGKIPINLSRYLVSEYVNRLHIDLHWDKCPINPEGSVLRKLVKAYEIGALSLDGKLSCELINIKKYIRVLRFSDLSEPFGSKSRWDFNYSKRPPKYLVFNNAIINTYYHNKPVYREGITSYFCRVKAEDEYFQTISSGDTDAMESYPLLREENALPIGWIMSRRRIIQCNGHARFPEDESTFNNYSSHHAAWILLKGRIRKKDKSRKKWKNVFIGCIRFEFYTEGDGHSDTREKKSGNLAKDIKEEFTKLSNNSLVEVLVSEIVNITRNRRDLGYDSQYMCLDPILWKLINIGNMLRWQSFKAAFPTDENGPFGDLVHAIKIHQLTEHLFYVFKRNTYFGDAIIDRISKYIEDLLKALNLPEMIFSSVWEELKKHEELMLYNIDTYRDHLMHQFHVFIIGYIIIYGYGIEDMRELIQKNYSKFIKSSSKRVDQDDGGYTKIDVIRIWALAALFHDCGYAFEKLADGFRGFSKRVLGAELDANFQWSEVILRTDFIAELLQRLSRYYISCRTHSPNYHHSTLFKIFLKEATLNNDHGVISSIILMQQCSKYSGGYMTVPRISPIMNISALAIALHNDNVYESFVTKGTQRICFNLNPMAFILGYCDSVQEWGRKKVSKDNGITPKPRLSEIIVPEPFYWDLQNNGRERRFRFKLLYSEQEKADYPWPNRILKFMHPVISSFNSSNKDVFEVCYNIFSDNIASFPLTYMVCGNKCHDSSKTTKQDIIEHLVNSIVFSEHLVASVIHAERIKEPNTKQFVLRVNNSTFQVLLGLKEGYHYSFDRHVMVEDEENENDSDTYSNKGTSYKCRKEEDSNLMILCGMPDNEKLELESLNGLGWLYWLMPTVDFIQFAGEDKVISSSDIPRKYGPFKAAQLFERTRNLAPQDNNKHIESSNLPSRYRK